MTPKDDGHNDIHLSHYLYELDAESRGDKPLMRLWSVQYTLEDALVEGITQAEAKRLAKRLHAALHDLVGQLCEPCQAEVEYD